MPMAFESKTKNDNSITIWIDVRKEKKRNTKN